MGSSVNIEIASLTENRIIWVPQESSYNTCSSVGVRFAAQTGPHAQHSSGPGCCDSSVDLAHAKTKAVGKSTLELPFSVLKRGETQDNSTWVLTLTCRRQQGGKKCCTDQAAQSVAMRDFFPLWICVIFMDREGFGLGHGTHPSSRTVRRTSDTEDKQFILLDGIFLNWWRAIYGTSIALPPLGFLSAAADHVLVYVCALTKEAGGESI